MPGAVIYALADFRGPTNYLPQGFYNSTYNVFGVSSLMSLDYVSLKIAPNYRVVFWNSNATAFYRKQLTVYQDLAASIIFLTQYQPKSMTVQGD